MSRSVLILASALASFGFGLTAYAGELDLGRTDPGPLMTWHRDEATRLPPLGEEYGADLRLESQRRDDLDRDLGDDDPDVTDLGQSVAEAERDLDRLRTSDTETDARIYHRELDEQVLSVEEHRRQVEGEPGGWR